MMVSRRATYALYRGDELLEIGTLEEIAKHRGVKPETIYFYSTPSYQRRGGNRLIAVRVDR